MKVLVVDDSPVVRRLVSARLAADGHRVSEASAGLQALERAAAEAPDAVVLDRMMPKMDGFEVCTRLRENPLTRDIAILILTDNIGEHSVLEALARGADDFMLKPFSPRELSMRVEMLRARRRER